MVWKIERDKEWPKLIGNLRIPRDATYSLISLEAELKEAGRRVTQKLRQDNRRAFGMGGHAHHGGRQWRKLRPATVARKGHGIILVDGHQPTTQWLRRRQSVLGQFRVSKGMITWRIATHNSAWYAKMHQFGFWHKNFKTGKRQWIKPRPPAWISEEDARTIDTVMRGLLPPGAGPRRRKRGR